MTFKELHLNAFWLVAALIFAVSTVAQAQEISTQSEVTVAWDANPEAEVVGYYVYCGPATGEFDQVVDVGNQTSVQVVVNSNELRRFAVGAYTNDGRMSILSAEVTYSYSVEDKAVTSPATTTSGIISLSPTLTGADQGGSLAVSWQVLSGPGSAQFSNTAALETSVSFDTPGTYTLEVVSAGETQYSRNVILLPVTDTSVAFVTALEKTAAPQIAKVPTVRVNGKKKLVIKRPTIRFTGKAAGDITRIVCREVGTKRQWIAHGTNNWSLTLKSNKKKRRVEFFAEGPSGNSKRTAVLITRKG